jgi:capsular polysaccharide biosynthesis protein
VYALAALPDSASHVVSGGADSLICLWNAAAGTCDRVIEALNATGIPFELVSTLATLSFEAQVALMAGTGLLIAPHGAALMNLVFLPQHASVIEVFSPPTLKKSGTS